MAKFKPVKRVFGSFLLLLFSFSCFHFAFAQEVPTTVIVVEAMPEEPSAPSSGGGGGGIISYPKIFDVKVFEGMDGYVHITFQTNIVCTFVFSYGRSKEYEHNPLTNLSFETLHEVILKDTNSDIQYFFQIFVQSKKGASERLDSYFVFHTPEKVVEPPVTPPVSTSTVSIEPQFPVSGNRPKPVRKPSVELGQMNTLFISPIQIPLLSPTSTESFVTSSILSRAPTTAANESITVTSSVVSSIIAPPVAPVLVKEHVENIKAEVHHWALQNERKFPWIILLSEVLFTAHPGVHGFFRTLWTIILSVY